MSSPAESVTATADPKSGGLTKVTLEPTAADLAPKAVKTLTLDENTLTDAPPSATATPERQQSDVEVTAGDSQPAGQHSAGEDSDTKLEPRPSPLITQLRTELDKALGEGPEAHDASLTNPTLSTSGILEAEEDGFY
ncbi:MAG: hypothetical protein GY703_18270 [Gammaproteobacteria bacterium]|nr:hypothetical protein [Gammaproteobacteria bacterium]